MRLLPLPSLVAFLLTSLLVGCGGAREPSAVREYLEEATGTTITYLAAPAAFVRGQPGLASSGRDYVYLAPFTVSRGGERSCWLWLGTWSTVDRQVRNANASPLKLGPVQIVVDNEPMDLETQPAETHPAGVRRLPYATAVPAAEQFLVPVTRSQLERLGHARVLALVDRPAGGAARLWRGDQRAAAVLGQFVDELGAPRIEPAPVTTR